MIGKDNINVRVGQGYEINRHSLLYLKAIRKGNAIKVYASGKVIEVARGVLL